MKGNTPPMYLVLQTLFTETTGIQNPNAIRGFILAIFHGCLEASDLRTVIGIFCSGVSDEAIDKLVQFLVDNNYRFVEDGEVAESWGDIDRYGIIELRGKFYRLRWYKNSYDNNIIESIDLEGNLSFHEVIRKEIVRYEYEQAGDYNV